MSNDNGDLFDDGFSWGEIGWKRVVDGNSQAFCEYFDQVVDRHDCYLVREDGPDLPINPTNGRNLLQKLIHPYQKIEIMAEFGYSYVRACELLLLYSIHRINWSKKGYKIIKYRNVKGKIVMTVRINHEDHQYKIRWLRKL